MKCHCARNVESQFPAPSSEHWYRKQAGYKTNIYTATEADCSNCIKVGKLIWVHCTCKSYHLLTHFVNAAPLLLKWPFNSQPWAEGNRYDWNRTRYWINWHTAKSTDLKWKKCSHICLLTFLLKRGWGLGGVSVHLKVDWSVPALKSSQSVSRTVRCLLWWSWWNFVQCVASAFFELLLSFSFT